MEDIKIEITDNSSSQIYRVLDEWRRRIFGDSKKKSMSKRRGWAKIEEKSDGPLSWTEYIDHDGFVFTVYNVRQPCVSAGFKCPTLSITTNV